MAPPSEISNRSELGHVMSTPDDPIVIDTQGDLLLDVHYSKDLIQYYRVSVSVLRKQSLYFHNLLSTNFSEGIKVDSRLATLRNCQKDIACVPPSALPTATISDIGIGPAGAQINVCEGSFVLLLEVLHGCLQWSIVKTKGYVRPIILAMLAHYAEAFAAIPAVSKEIHALSEKGCIRGNARPTKDVKEDKSRQKIYAGLILDLPEWVQTHSAALIIWGSKSWVGETERSNGVETEGYPWDYLSGGVEATKWTDFIDTAGFEPDSYRGLNQWILGVMQGFVYVAGRKSAASTAGLRILTQSIGGIQRISQCDDANMDTSLQRT
ncbi:MAG: hypothetical protein Q9205_006685, partial [Flavoplaca limonia]